jgi:hypothetical protein
MKLSRKIALLSHVKLSLLGKKTKSKTFQLREEIYMKLSRIIALLSHVKLSL